MLRIKLLICLVFCYVAVSVHASTDTIRSMHTKVNYGVATTSIRPFGSFEWSMRVRTIEGHVSRLVTRRPDTALRENNLDSVLLTSSFFFGDSVSDRLLALRYSIEGSMRVVIDDSLVIATGCFATDKKEKRLERTDYGVFLGKRQEQRLEILYLPYPQTHVFNLDLKISSLADARVHMAAADDGRSESRAAGFYYLAFGIVFITLFILFREQTENLYFALFCLFAALSFLWDSFHCSFLYNLESTLSVLCFEFLSIFFYKILKGREKSKIPLIVILCLVAICFLPAIRFRYEFFFDKPFPWLLSLIFGLMICYTCLSVLVFLIQGIGQKRWEAKVVLICCFIPLVLFILAFVFFFLYVSIIGQADNVGEFFGVFIENFTTAIVYVYPLSAVVILGRRNGLNEKQLLTQIQSIRELSEENLLREREKKELLENMNRSLEKEVEIRTAEIVAQKEEIERQHGELKVEKKKSDDLLLNILPEEVATELKEKGSTRARLFDDVTVLFADFVGFTIMGEVMTAQELVTELHTCFKAFDEIVSEYGVEKIKTIGDAYLAVGGLPVPDNNHAIKMMLAAIDIKKFMEARYAELGDRTFRVRIGVHTGSVVAGIVGVKKFSYDIWGDTVNTAARMEQSSEAGKINVSETTYQLVKHRFDCIYRGEIPAKNKGMLRMYFVNGEM